MSGGIPSYDLLKFDIKYQMDKIGKFAQWVEDNLQSQSSEALDKDNSGFPKDWIELKDEHIFDLRNTLPRLARNSLFSNLYSFVEYEFELLCRSCFEQFNNIKLADLKDKGIERSRVYFKKIAKVPLPDFFNGDEDHGILNIVRNSIVHNYGFVAENKVQRLQTLRGKLPVYRSEIDLDSVYRLTLNAKFIPIVIERCNNMFNELFDSLDHKLSVK